MKLDGGYIKGDSGGIPITHKQLGKVQASKELTRLIQSGDLSLKDKHIVRVESGSGGGAGGEAERERSGGSRNVSKRAVPKKIGEDELVDGWPKWLVDNVSADLLEGLVPKSADSYDKLAKIGQGTYSNVYKARDRITKKIVALKKVRFDTSEPESVKFMAREITMLKRLDHPNIIKLEGLATSRMQYSLYLVFDFMQLDLTKIISGPRDRLNEAQVKCYMQQLLSGLQHCHENGVLHRDIKPSNLLIDKKGVLKIADFGLANLFVPNQKCPLTSRVVTLWYRAPELLLGSTDYGVGIDLWSAGCLLAEMFVGRPIMPGRTEVEQLHKIFKLCGKPSEEDYWKKMKLPTTFQPPSHYEPSFQEAFRAFPTSSFGLLTTLLALDPTSRGSAASALQNEFFTSSPLACDLSALPAPGKEKDESRTSTHKKLRPKTKKPSQTNREGDRTEAIIAQASGDFDASKEWKNEEPHMHSQEMGYGASSPSSSVQTRRHQRILHESLSPVLRSHKILSPKTEGHHNALKNIKDLTLLHASITDIINPNEGNIFAQYRTSLSEVDFRNRDPDKIPKFFRVNKDSQDET